MLLLISTISIFADSDNDHSGQTNVNIEQTVLQDNNQLPLPQFGINQFFEFIDSEGAPTIFWGGFAACMGMLYLLEKFIRNIEN